MTTHLNGCHNREPFKDTLEVQDGYGYGSENGRVDLMKTIPFTMSRDCNYTHTELGQKDAGCIGCKWRHNEVPTQATR